MTARPRTPARAEGASGRARRRALVVVLIGASIALVSVAAPAGADSTRGPIPPITLPPIDVPPIKLAPALSVSALGLHVAPQVGVDVPSVGLPQLGLQEVLEGAAASGAQPAPAATSVPDATSGPTGRSGSSTASETDAASAPRPVRAHLPVLDDETAVLDLARSSTALFILLGAAIAFLLVQGRLDRRSRLLATPPLDRSEEVLEFP